MSAFGPEAALRCGTPSRGLQSEKDYQQLMVVRGMVRQFALPVEIVGCEAQRAADALALSSRNGYLSPAERDEAVYLPLALQRMAQQVRAGVEPQAAEADAMRPCAGAAGNRTT